MAKREREKLMLGERCLRVCGVSGVHHDCVCVLAPALFGFSGERVANCGAASVGLPSASASALRGQDTARSAPASQGQEGEE